MDDATDPPPVDAAPDLGVSYEATLADEERAAHGRFYTPPALAAACCRWAIRPADGHDRPRVLDPAAGAGAFVVAAVERLRVLGVDPTTVRGQVTAVDVDGAALAVAQQRIARQPAPEGDGVVTTVEADFLDSDPDDLGRFDAVVGNPPYVRQEGLDKDRARGHLAALGPDGATPYLDGDPAIDARSDAYVYFLTNTTRFLRPGGRLAMVVPTKWLATRYGEALQRFLLDHYRVNAVVGFASRAFDDALVDAALLCCQRRTDPHARRSGDVRFVRVSAADAATLVTAIEGGAGDGDGEADGVNEVGAGDADGVNEVGAGDADGAGSRTIAVDQADLDGQGPGKLAHYLDAPPALVDLLDADCLVPLGDLATVSYGQKTGANDLFVLGPDDPVADRFRAPAVTSFRDIEGVVLAADDAPAEMLDVHDYVAGVLDGDEDDPAGAVLDALDADGYGETAGYIRQGASQGYDERTTCATRRVWFDLGPLRRPPVLHPKFFDERIRVIHNRAGAVPSNAIDCLAVRDPVPVEPLLGALNSSLYRAALECWGRSEGGGALQLMTYELQRVHVPDVRTFAHVARERVREAFRAYACGAASQRRLDAAVLDAAGLDVAGLDAAGLDVAGLDAAGPDDGPERIASLREALVRRRVDGASDGSDPG